jgi:hypothetical protein
MERAFAWTERRRRLARDHGATTAASFILANAMVLAKRLARPL